MAGDRREYRVVMAAEGRFPEGLVILLGRVNLEDEGVRDAVAARVHRRLAGYLGREDFTTIIDFTMRRVYAERGQLGRGVLERVG